MSPLDDRARVRHMLDAAEAAQRFVVGRSRSDLDDDLQLLMALAHCLQIIGEASSRLCDDARQALGEMPWNSIRGMRNQIVHVYFDIDNDIVWTTVIDDLPPLIEALRAYLDRSAD